MARLLSRVRARPEVWILTAVSAAFHFWRLFTPNAVVFDEVHYERFTGYYLAHSYFFDVHPPVGRLLYVVLAALLHIPSAQLTTPVAEPVLRVLPATFGTLLVPLTYLLLRQLGANRRVATLGATMLLLENALLVIARLILVDVMLIAFGMMALTAYLAARTRVGRARWAWLAASACCAGLSLSIKWTGASALGMILAAWGIGVLRAVRPTRRTFAEGIVLVLVPAVIYCGAFAIHFAMLTNTGPGDVYMPMDFRATLRGSRNYSPNAHLSYWKKLAEMHHAMSYGNEALESLTNPGASKWYTWPIMKHPISLWGDPRLPGDKQMIILLGNPVVWWAGLIAFFGGVLSYRFQRDRWRGREFAFWFLAGGILLNYVPFMAIKRLMYLYHYLFALTLMISFGAYVFGVATRSIDDDGAPWRLGGMRLRTLYGGVVVLALIGFIYYLPLSYGYAMSNAAWNARFWVLHPHF
ncbi:MAG TPA: phospholipid carrier-dependent glycosyltransferase [Gemmatimonadaceae bacterium]|nr:phospholipid carrier-dependent glycosyltransferase [Gemmatimonadaceae bacterium]